MLDRRDVLTAAAVMLGSCATPGGPSTDPPPGPLADAHVHLFNAADLPVGKFARYVLIPRYLPDLGDEAAALADHFLHSVKSLARPARDERITSPRAVSLGGEVSAAAYGRAVARRIRQLQPGQRAQDAAPGEPTLLDSYLALLRRLARGADIARPDILGLTVTRAADREAVARTAERLFTDAASVFEDPAALDAGLARTLAPSEALSLGRLLRLIGWGRLMCQSRQHHLRKYLREYAIPRPDARTPTLILNHLVDYDAWLGETPSPSSGHLDQVDFYARLMDAPQWRERVDVRTFAGYCPLKHAIERVQGSTPTLDALKGQLASGDLTGFKIYPPMGFQAAGNGGLCDQATRPCPNDRAFQSPIGEGLGTTATDAWRDAGGRGGLGAALDRALQDFLTWAGQADVPLMAHAGPGNAAGPGFGLRASPALWKAPIEAYGLRFMIGHLVEDPKRFVQASEGLEPIDATKPVHWAFGAPLDLLTPDRKVYADIAYTPELLGDRDLARRFFEAIKRTFGPKDPELSRILFGSDWIMVAQEKNDREFANTVLRGMEAAKLGSDAIENILWNNARRFAKVTP